MPDIQLRFHNDMLVLSAPIDATLARQGIDAARDRQYLNLMEPDVVKDAFKLEMVAGAHCLVTTTEDITRARLAHVSMDGDESVLARSATSLVNELKPQHVLAEIGPCGLPLDPSSKSSLNENRAQYADATRAFESDSIDAFFLNGFTSIPDLKCALMGVAQASAKPVFASVLIGENGNDLPDGTIVKADYENLATIDDMQDTLPFSGYETIDASTPSSQPARRKTMDAALLPEAVAVMVEFGASVVGFETADDLAHALEYAQTAVSSTELPVLAQLRAKASNSANKVGTLSPIDDASEYSPVTMEHAAVRLYGAGVQFLRATGAATPAFTGALAATVQGLDVNRK